MAAYVQYSIDGIRFVYVSTSGCLKSHVVLLNSIVNHI